MFTPGDDHAHTHAGFKGFAAALEVHLVEVSPALRAMQWAALKCSPHPTLAAPNAGTIIGAKEEGRMPPAVSGLNGAQVCWGSLWVDFLAWSPVFVMQPTSHHI